MFQKPKWKPRQAALPLTKVLTQAEVIVLLTRQVFEDARSAGWLEPCCRKPTARSEGREFYAVAAVEDVQNRMLAGEYPETTSNH
ncbi:hypothetical protein [Verrucomicrobium spinosum]|uniref:hypothetical protein n=1 Tax=Verrucomicrobium spinosum TaxID=2736 RepID=UPI000301F7AB|nr:hypothetical protein [Verrucomicrobium spinosum]